MTNISIDMSEYREFFQRMGEAARNDLKRELKKFLESLGEEFLRMVQDEFINRHKNTGYGQLISSFVKNGTNNVWRFENDGLTLEVSTNVKYTGYVNDGHRTSKTGKTRFVPGHWRGNRFIYEPGANEGMVLKFHWVEDLHFWEAAVHAIESLCPEMLDAKIQQWMDTYLG